MSLVRRFNGNAGYHKRAPILSAGESEQIQFGISVGDK